jgi:hypothetical protein
MNTIISLIAAFVSVLVALSVASERIVEILKKIFPKLDQTLEKKKESYRQSLIHILAAGVGILIAWITKDQIAAMLPEKWTPFATSWPGYSLLGIMSSGGSAFWNSVLDMIRAIKISRAARAEMAVLELNERRRELGMKPLAKAAMAS